MAVVGRTYASAPVRRRARDGQIEKLAADCRADEAGLIAELSELGIQVNSVWDLDFIRIRGQIL